MHLRDGFSCLPAAYLTTTWWQHWTLPLSRVPCESLGAGRGQVTWDRQGPPFSSTDLSRVTACELSVARVTAAPQSDRQTNTVSSASLSRNQWWPLGKPLQAKAVPLPLGSSERVGLRAHGG